ncbi:hypothetical protein GcM1_248066 [Golovinomyces cichoracearum]|uniref:Uncharacterized protein n=1 Tax=Golovinomyces cichoracearum TaxID=62708 RepID=A0A420ICR0_9PEZI|nr:hypothetical protein GcM1_248066 [Golovinomyces cichoracearum]
MPDPPTILLPPMKMTLFNHLHPDHPKHQEKFFDQRLAEVKGTLNTFYGTLDTITVPDPELCKALEKAIAGLLNEVQAILWGQLNKAATDLTVLTRQLEKA